MNQMPREVPVIGWPGREGEMRAVEPYTLNLMVYGDGERLITRATRIIDRLILEGQPYGGDWAALRWLEFKGYARRVAFEIRGRVFGDFVWEPTDEGRAFHRQHAAPVGEW